MQAATTTNLKLRMITTTSLTVTSGTRQPFSTGGRGQPSQVQYSCYYKTELIEIVN